MANGGNAGGPKHDISRGVRHGGVFVTAFLALVSLLATLGDGLGGLQLLVLATIGSLGATLAAHELRKWHGPTDDKDTSQDAPNAVSWLRGGAAGAAVTGVVVAAALLSGAHEADDPDSSGPVAIPGATDAGSTQYGSDSSDLPNSETTVPAEPGTAPSCGPLSDSAVSQVANSLHLDEIRPGIDLGFLQSAALPVCPARRQPTAGYTVLTYAQPEWVVTVAVDCDEQVVAYTVTTTDPERFSPIPDRCVGIDQPIASVRLPAFGGGTVYTLAAAVIPNSYMEFRGVAGFEGCRTRTSIAIVGSIVAFDLVHQVDSAMSRGGYEILWAQQPDMEGPATAVPGGGSLIVKTGSAADVGKPGCGRATTWGESDLRDIEEFGALAEAGFFPLHPEIRDLTGVYIPETYSSEFCSA